MHQRAVDLEAPKTASDPYMSPQSIFTILARGGGTAAKSIFLAWDLCWLEHSSEIQKLWISGFINVLGFFEIFYTVLLYLGAIYLWCTKAAELCAYFPSLCGATNP